MKIVSTLFELLINVFLIEKYYGKRNGAISSSVPINSKILKSGEQTWKNCIYPVHNDGVFQKTILEVFKYSTLRRHSVLGNLTIKKYQI